MSYILDALKKAEADRNPDARTSLAMAQHEQRRNRWLVHAVVIALIANAAILLWLFLPNEQQDSTEPEVAAQGVNRQATPAKELPAQAPLPVVGAPSRADTTPPEPERAEQALADTPAGIEASDPRLIDPTAMAAESATGETIIGPGTNAAPPSEPVPVSSLPSDQRARFPTLEFSTHVYADDADLRAIVVNGRRLEEGDRLGNLRLAEITEDGAVFSFENRLVSVSVLDEWN